MTGRITIILLSILITTNAFSQVSSDSQLHLENIPREKSEAIDKNWEVVPTIKSIHQKKFKGKKSEIYHQSKDTVYVKKIRDIKQPLLNVENEDEAHIVFNPKKRQVGSISGAIIINFNQISDFENLIKDYPLKIIRVEKELSLAIVKVKKGNDIALIVSNLKKDPRVKNASVEINSNKLMPQ